MRRAVLILACLSGLVVGSLGGAAVVLAQGTSTSAGDQQYVDPLTGNSSTSHPSGSSSSSSSSSGSSSSGASSSSATATPTQGTLTTGTSSSTGSTATNASSSARSGTLPFTGINIWACVAIGAVMLGSGLALRRVLCAT